MKNIVVYLAVKDEDVDEMLEWAQRLLNANHPWLPGSFFKYVRDIKIEKEAIIND